MANPQLSQVMSPSDGSAPMQAEAINMPVPGGPATSSGPPFGPSTPGPVVTTHMTHQVVEFPSGNPTAFPAAQGNLVQNPGMLVPQAAPGNCAQGYVTPPQSATGGNQFSPDTMILRQGVGYLQNEFRRSWYMAQGSCRIHRCQPREASLDRRPFPIYLERLRQDCRQKAKRLKSRCPLVHA